MADLEALEARSLAAETKFQQDRWSVNKIRDNDKATKFFTGLPSFAVFLWLFKLVSYEDGWFSAKGHVP